MSTIQDNNFEDIRKAIAGIAAEIDAARNKRESEASPDEVRRMATRRADMPWWMKKAG